MPQHNASARFGPYAIRSGSQRIRESSGYTVSWGSSPFDQGARILDCGDVRRGLFKLICEFDLRHLKVPVSRFDNMLAMDQIEVAYSTLLNRPIPGDISEGKEHIRVLSKDGLEHPRIVRQATVIPMSPKYLTLDLLCLVWEETIPSWVGFNSGIGIKR